jgi:hypothetical protein
MGEHAEPEEPGRRGKPEIGINLSMFRTKPHADVLPRVFDLAGHGMTPALAEGILALQRHA